MFYNHRRLFRRVLRPVIIQFMRLQKEQQIETTNKNSIEKRFRSRKAIICPSENV